MRLPLRLRLTLTYAIAMALVLVAVGWMIYVRLASELLRGLDQELRARGDVIVSSVASHGPVAIGSGEKLIDPDEAFAQVLDAHGRILDTTSAVGLAAMVSPIEAATITQPVTLVRRVTGVSDPARLLVIPATTGGLREVVVVGATLGDRSDALARLRNELAIGGPVALLLSSLVGWVVAGGALRPVESLRREAAAISVSELDRRIEVPATRDELARLAETLNALLGRLQHGVAREHRFVDDASHELRTPLTVLKAELDLALTRPRSAQELETTVRSASAETDRLVRLAEDLLVLARARGGQVPLRVEPVFLPELLNEAMVPFRLIAESAGVVMTTDAPDLVIHADRARLRQAIENMIDNAIRHGGPGPVSVCALPEDDGMRINVSDSGPGFPPVLLGRVFEPFVRHQTGGTGLGLAIVEAVAGAHRGVAVAENLPDRGARVSILLPAASRIGTRIV